VTTGGSEAITKKFYITKGRSVPDVTQILQTFAAKAASPSSTD